MALRFKLPPVLEAPEIQSSYVPFFETVIPVIPVTDKTETPAGSPITTLEHLADLDTEEALLRTWWATLPDKKLAFRTWHSTLKYYCQERSLEQEMMESLKRRARDLWDGDA